MINFQRMQTILCRCRLEQSHSYAKAILVEGPAGILGFQPERLELHEAEILSMLEQLPPWFRASQGGEGSACTSIIESNCSWDEHLRMVQVFYLGMAIGKIRGLPPNEQWFPLPGKTPYYRYRNVAAESDLAKTGLPSSEANKTLLAGTCS